MKIAIYGEKLEKNNIKYISKFLNYAYQQGIEIFCEKKFLDILLSLNNFDKLKINIFVSHEDLSKRLFNFMFTFGGDGTILSAITLIRDLEIPIVGINTGNLGFLASFNKEIFIKKIDNIFNKKLKPLQRSLLWLEIYGNKYFLPHSFLNFSLNEISILRRETVSMMTIDAYINNVFLTSYWADGLIISTPTGSTGYSLSCGGPIITPESKNFVLTPIAPHNLFSRPFVVPDNENIRLKIHSRANTYSLSMDTRLNIMNVNNELYIKKAPFYSYIFQEENGSYFKTLHEKLLWGADKRN